MPGYELIGQEERDAVNQIFDNGGVFFAHGFHERRKGIYHVREFEQQFAQYFGVQHALAVTSGTAALKIALKALGVGPGDEVITQAFTFVATVEAIIEVGATPIVINVDHALNMDLIALKQHINAKTKAIILVHMLGYAADVAAICALAKQHNVPVVEDNCEAIGAQLNGKLLGTISDIGAFSFDFGKAITTGEGGMLITDNPTYAKYIREYHDHGHENNTALPRGRDTKTIPGFNYRMTDLQGAIGKVQLKKLNYLLAENKQRFKALEEKLQNLLTLRPVLPNSISLCDTFMFSVTDKELREKIIDFLHKAGFGTKNVPDAVEWHFAGYWDHMLSQQTIAKLAPSREILNKYVAIPVNLTRAVEDYQQLAANLANLITQNEKLAV